ncbi:hypothetical protein [Epibacterium ulvae]|uniref:hypothetical protein n=1 Tax=Epibacterium ulvae TaxID=1156985 RepID=UPI002491A5EF|nr:hypothetical protein [Epibacterium ulvae]
MKQKMLEQMAAVTAAQYMQEHAKIKPILDNEARLRGNIAKLDAQLQDSKAQVGQDLPMKALGADLLWQGWHSRTKRQLNIELAQATAQKMMAMERLKKSFGRKHAVETMAKDEKNRLKKEKIALLQSRLLQQ